MRISSERTDLHSCRQLNSIRCADADSLTAILRTAPTARFRVTGRSMRPFLRDGDVVDLATATTASLRAGDILAYRRGDGHVCLHRLVALRPPTGGATVLRMAADAFRRDEESIPTHDLLGRVVRIRRGDRVWTPRRGPGLCWYRLRPLRRAWLSLRRLLRRAATPRPPPP